jgi:hypothetical protein
MITPLAWIASFPVFGNPKILLTLPLSHLLNHLLSRLNKTAHLSNDFAI